MASVVGGVASTLGGWAVLLGASSLQGVMCSLGLFALAFGATKLAISLDHPKTPKLDLTKPTNSPAMNELFAFCKNNGISIKPFDEKGREFFGFQM